MASTGTDLRDAVALKRIWITPLSVRCAQCDVMSPAVDVGTNPQHVGDELMLFGVVRFVECGHICYCPHLARRCATILEHIEQDTLMPEDFCGLVAADHEPDPT